MSLNSKKVGQELEAANNELRQSIEDSRKEALWWRMRPNENAPL